MSQVIEIQSVFGQESCPYVDLRNESCEASLHDLELKAEKLEDLCSTDRHGDCPMLLSKILRKY